MRLPAVVRPRGRHRAVPAPDPALVALAELIASGDVESTGREYCPSCFTRTTHTFNPDGSSTCHRCHQNHEGEL